MDEMTRKAAFDKHAREQQQAWLRLSYRQRLDRLWQAKLFAARALQTAEERRAGEAATSAKG